MTSSSSFWGLLPHSNSNNIKGPDYCSTAGPFHSNIAGPDYCSTAGPFHSKVTGPDYCNTTGPDYCSGLAGRRIFFYCLILLIPWLVFSCSEAETVPFEEKILMLLDEKKFDEALEHLQTVRVADEESDISYVDTEDPIVHASKLNALKIHVHLSYANYLTHEAGHLDMGTRMSDALRHYRRVLQLDENHQMARTHIELIEGIYVQMGRDIPQGAAE